MHPSFNVFSNITRKFCFTVTTQISILDIGYGVKVMGVKSTKSLSRERAEEKFISNAVESARKKIKEDAKLALKTMTDTELEDALEEYDDSLYGDETGFDNYLINRISKF